MTEAELQALCAAEEREAIGGDTGTLSEQRRKAMEYYLGEPLGNEEDGRSQVVSTEVSDTIEWIMPALMKIFTASGEVVRFEPTGPEDEEAAQQATDYVNWVFNQKNEGFIILYDLCKDGLLQKNGIAKIWWEERTDKETRTLGPVDDDTWMLEQTQLGEGEEITAHTVLNPGDDGYPQPEAPAMPAPASPRGMNGTGPAGAAPDLAAAPGLPGAGLGGNLAVPPGPMHEFTVTKKVKRGQVKVCGVPPEEFLISKLARSIREANYVAHRFRRRLGDLIAEGYDREKVENLPTSNSHAEITSEADTRREFVEETTGQVTETHRQGIMRDVWLVEEYVLCDWDGDGIPEHRKVLRVSGPAGPILDHEDWDGPAPFISGSPIRMPHRFVGISIADQVMDLQLVKSQIIRQVIDNLYQTNHPELIVSDQVNLDDLLVTRLAKFNRLKSGARPGDGHVTPLTVPFTAGASLPVIEYFDTVRENRTGVTRYNQGIDADSLNKTARGIMQIMTAAQQRIELIARLFSETAIKDLFWHILRCAQKYNTGPQMVRLRNRFVPMDPRQWANKFDLSVSVGLGTGNRDQMLMHLQMLLQVLAQIVAAQGQFGVEMVTAQHIYNAVKKLINNMGEKAEEQFIQPPRPTNQPPPPDPKMVEAEGRLRLAQQKQQTDAQLAQQKQANEARLAETQQMIDARKTAVEIAAERDRAEAEMEIDAQRTEAELTLEERRIEAEIALMREKHKAEMEIRREEARARREEAKVKLLIGASQAVQSMQLKREQAREAAE